MIPTHPDQDFDIQSFKLPSTQTAIVQAATGGLEIKHGLSLPAVLPHRLLVKTMAVALNPCDFKMHTRFPCPGAVNGCDFSGIVVAQGSDTCKTGSFRLGDGVFGAVHGSNRADPTSGAFAEYVAVDAEFVFRMPREMTWEDAACIGGTGPGTLGLVLKEEMNLPGLFAEPATSPLDVLVCGGATSIGSMAIQMVTAMGHRAITTCSPKNEAMVRSLGAIAVYDYHDAEFGKQVRIATGNNLRYVLDPFAEVKTMVPCFDAIGRAGGNYIALEVYREALRSRRSVKAKFVNGLSILGYDIDLDQGYGVASSESRRQFGVTWFEAVQKLIDEGKLRSHPIKSLPTGFEAILEGLELWSARKVSAQKLVGRIAFDATEVVGASQV